MVESAEKPTTCVAKFRSVILISAVAIVAVTGYVLLRPARGGGRGWSGPPAGAGPSPAATAPTIAAGTRAPHPDFGPCTRCHNVVGGPNAGNSVVPAAAAPPIAADARLTHPQWGPCRKCHQITGGNDVVPAAAAPPIAANAPLTHPDWGPCQKCHQVTGSATTPAAFPASGPQGLLGARVEDLTADQANVLDMEIKEGAIVTQVIDNSPAAEAGLKVDDTITRVNKDAVKSVKDLRDALAGLEPGSKVKLTVARGEVNKNIFFRVPAVANAVAGAAPTSPAPATTVPSPSVMPAAFASPAQIPGRVAIAATSASEEAQVAPVFSDAVAFLVRDGLASRWLVAGNPWNAQIGRGQATAQMLSKYGVSAVIAGNVGAGAFSTLTAANILVFSGAFGSVRAVYEQYLLNQLVPSTSTIVPVAATPAPAGTVAVAAMGGAMSAPVCPDFSGAPYFILFDLRTRSSMPVANPARGDEGVGSLSLVQFLADRGVTAVIAGNTNSSTVATLSRYGIMGFFGVEGKVEEAVNMYAAGALRGATTFALGVVR